MSPATSHFLASCYHPLWGIGVSLSQSLSLLNPGVWLLPSAAFALEGSIRLPLLRNFAICASAFQIFHCLIRKVALGILWENMVYLLSANLWIVDGPPNEVTTVLAGNSFLPIITSPFTQQTSADGTSLIANKTLGFIDSARQRD